MENSPASQSAELRPLSGVRVLDLVPGPMAAIARYYADLGADVIRLEPAGGAPDRLSAPRCDGVSLAFAAGNAGKRAGPLTALERLLPSAHIVIVPPGLIDVAAVRAAHPALVVLLVSDFGKAGPLTDWVGSDAVHLALAGVVSRSGIPGREPLLPPEGLGLGCAAAHGAFVGLLAYWNALRSGEGDVLDFAVLDGVAHALDPGYGIAGSATGGAPASQMPRGRPEARHMYPILPCRDGHIRLCILAPRQWQSMFAWMGSPAEFADPSFNTLQVRFQSQTLLPAIAQFLAAKTRAEAEAEAQQFGVPAAAVLSLDEALATDQIAERGAFCAVPVADGVQVRLPDGVLEVDGARMGLAGPIPAVPADTDAALAWHDCAAPRGTLAAAERPLDGVRVLDLGVIVVGAETSRVLADQGADVIKIESAQFPDGARQNTTTDAISPSFAAGHRNKRSLGINLRDPRGKALVLELVRQSDVLLSNFKGGTLRSLGLDYESLKAINPRIIVTDSSAFGPTGPWATRMGYGPLVRASSGLTMQWRYPGERDGFSDAVTVFPDHVAARIGALGVLALLIRRERSGCGGQISMGQAEVIMSQMAVPIAAEQLAKAGHVVVPDPAVSRVYRCAGDDEWCVVTLRDAADQARASGVTEGQELADWLAAQTPDAAMRALQAAGVPAGAMLRVGQLPDFAHFAARHFFRAASNPHRTLPFTIDAAPVLAERLPAPPDHPAPLAGEHTTMLLRERLGLDEAEIRGLIEQGVLEQARP